MDRSMLRATLEVAGTIRVEHEGHAWDVSLVRAGDWRGSPYLSHYDLMLLVSRLRRWLRRDHRWFVEVAAAGLGKRDGEVRAEAGSRSEAVDCAVAVAEELAST
jgi:hypothetical protein